MSNRLWLAFLVPAFALPIAAQEHWQADYDRVRLFTECRPIIVGGMNTTDEIETMAENHLRAAGLLLEDPPFLEGTDVWLDIATRPGEQPRLRFQKMLNDPVSGSRGGVTTLDTFWDRHRFPAMQPRQDVRARISDLLDAFILEYLRVNEGSC